MPDTNIHVIPHAGDDWVVREDESQRERGHYPTRTRPLPWAARSVGGGGLR